MHFNSKVFESGSILDALDQAQGFITTLPVEVQHLTKIASSDGNSRPARVILFYPDAAPSQRFGLPPNVMNRNIYTDEKGFEEMVESVKRELNVLQEDNQAFAQVSGSNGEGLIATLVVWA